MYLRLGKNLTLLHGLFALLSHVYPMHITRTLNKMPLGLGTVIRKLLQVRKCHKMNLVFLNSNLHVCLCGGVGMHRSCSSMLR